MNHVNQSRESRELALGKKQIRENTCFKHNACLVEPLGVLYDFRIFKIPCFFEPQKGGPNHEKGPVWEGPFFEWSPQFHKGSELASHPVCCVGDSSLHTRRLLSYKLLMTSCYIATTIYSFLGSLHWPSDPRDLEVGGGLLP